MWSVAPELPGSRTVYCLGLRMTSSAASSASSSAASSACSNIFRADWLYQRLPAGAAMLEAGKGLSPAFLKLLGAIGTEPVAFGALSESFPSLDADDLELWLAELCRMQLIAPAVQPEASAPAAAQAKTPAAAGCPRLLLVHKLPSTRLAWRDLLGALPVELIEAGSLEEADAAYNKLQPQGVVLGPEGSDFNALNLLHVLKHPRAPRPVKVFLVLDEAPAGARIKAAAARADDTVHAGEWTSLPERVARQLNLATALPLSSTQVMLELAPESATLGAAPSTLERDYPRIAAMIADQWEQKTLDTLFDSLIFDSRGDRAGLSPAAMQDLLFLYRLHRELRPLEEAWHPGMQAAPRARRARPSGAALRKTARLRTLTLEPIQPAR